MFVSDAAALELRAGSEAATPPSRKDALTATGHESASNWHQPLLFSRYEGTHSAASLRADRFRRCRSVDASFFPVHQPVPARPSLIFLSLLNNEKDTNSLSSDTSQSADTEAHCSQVDSQVSPPDTSTAHHEQDATGFVSDRTFPLCTVQSDEGLKTLTTSTRQTDSEEPCDSSMLSSTVVTVMAPHFGRRTQRFNSQGNMQDGIHVQTDSSQDFQGSHRSMSRMFSNASQDQLRTRRSTVDWSTNSGPVSLNYGTKSNTLYSVQTGVEANRNKVGSTRPEIRSVLSDVDRKSTSQTTEQGSSLSTKPMTSSLLLSLRRMNSNNHGVNGTQPVSENQHPTQSSSTRTEDGKLFKTHHGHTLNSRTQDRFHPTPSSSCGTRPTSESNKTTWFSSSTDKVGDAASQRIGQTQSRFLASRQAFMEGRPYSSLQERGDLGKEIPKPSPKDSVNEVFNKTPLRSNRSESLAGWKQHSYDSPLIINEANTLKKPNLVSSNNIYNMQSSGLADSTRAANEVKNNGHSCKSTYSFNLSTVKKSPPKEVKSESQQTLQNLPDLLVSSKITTSPTPNVTFRKPSLTLDLSSTVRPGFHRAQSSPVSPPRSNPSPSFLGSGSHKATSPTPIGFERSYVSMPKPFQSDGGSKISHTIDIMSKRNFTPLHSTSLFATKPPMSPNPSSLTPPPANTLNLLTPPSTPVPSYSDTTRPKPGRAGSSGAESNTLKPEKAELKKEKKKRRVTWEDSVENLKPISDERLDTSPRSPQSPTRSPRSINAPSMFSFLRTNNPSSNSPPASSPSPTTTPVQLEKKDKYRSLSSDSADMPSTGSRSRHRFSDSMDLQQASQDTKPPRQETASVLSRSTEALSLPPDFLSGYKVRYSSPPYSTLVSTRSIQGEGKRPTPRSPLFKEESHSGSTGQHRYVLTHRTEELSAPKSELRQSTANPRLSPKASSFSDGFNSDSGKNIGPLLLIDNRLHVSPKDKQAPTSLSTCVTETLVYSVNANANNAPASNIKPDLLPDTSISPASSQAKQAAQKALDSDRLSHNGSQRADDVSVGTAGQNQKTDVMGKNRFNSVEDIKEQNPKKSRFALRKPAGTPGCNLSRSDSDRSNKSNGKMTVLSKLKQTFSTKRSEDDPVFPWKFKRATQPPSLSGLSDTSTSSESAESNKTPHRVKDENKENVRIRNDGWIQKRYSKPMSMKSTNENHQFSLAQDVQDGGKVQQNLSEGRGKVCWTNNLPTLQIEVSKPINLHDTKDASLSVSPNHIQLATSSSPRSPFSPFTSLSPLSPHSPPDAIDDNVFYSPKLRRRKDSLSPLGPREGISLGGSTRSRLSTGPPSIGSGNGDTSPSSYADLKYGIEPGRSVSVSSVLSSRPSGPGRISTGSRVMSVGDLTAPGLSCRRSSRDTDQWALYPDWTTDYRGRTYSQDDLSQMRSRSLPRSLTRHLANWGSEMSGAPAPLTTSKSGGPWSPTLNICQFTWDTDGPPTPPPTPPPATRRMSKPSSVSSSNSPASSVETQDSPPPRGRLPSRGYISSLSSFQESSESSSDTTTDDEYYLDSDEEKETEL